MSVSGSLAGVRDPLAGLNEKLLTEMQAIVHAAAEPWRVGESVKAAIRRAARRLGLSARRAETFWYAQPARVLAIEADRLRAWHGAWCAGEAARLESRLAELAARQAAIDAERRGATAP